MTADDTKDFLTSEFPELRQFPTGIDSYEKLHRFSVENNDLFWSTIAKSRLQWIQEFSQVKSGDFNDENFKLKWFIDGKLNVSGKHTKKTLSKTNLKIK